MATSKTPAFAYQQALDAGLLQPDPAQAKAIEALEKVYQSLKKNASKSFSWASFLKRNPPVKGVYLFGGVGRGKSYLMGLFFETLTFFSQAEKRRIHFNRFMEDLHHELRRRQGEKDPLKTIAFNLGKTLKVLCFDEFFVEDIADAMILGLFFTYLFEAGVCVIATSNSAPDQLYLEGLKREQFLPAIASIQKNMEVLSVDNGRDYRTQGMFDRSLRYFYPLDDQFLFLKQHFDALVSQYQDQETTKKLVVCGRTIDVIRQTEHVLWIDFADLCKSPRGKADYIQLVDRYPAILIQNIPVLTPDIDDQARRFMAFIDEAYDRGTFLIVSAEASPERLYQGDRYSFAFARTASRLKTLLP